jgi:hypothetical protein
MSLIIQKWFDEDLDAPVGGVAFDPALMAAISRPWPDIVFSKPQVVAAGMTPPSNLPT